MNHASLFRLIALAAIWGASFLFLRIGAPPLGPVWLIFLRVLLAALFLLVVGRHLAKVLDARHHWRHFLLLGLFNSALPFLLFAQAATVVPASLLSILNATAPIWATLIGALWTRTPPTGKAATGMLLGVGGVALLTGFEAGALPHNGGYAIAAALGAACCYGIATTYANSASPVEPFANAHGSMWAATLLLVPALYFVPLPSAAPSAGLVSAVLALGVVCSGLAYLLYFRLIADLGAASALTVTFLIPVFGVLWGHLFLDEAVGWHTLAGTALVLLGTALTTGFSPRAVFVERRPSAAS